jgi:integrase
MIKAKRDVVQRVKLVTKRARGQAFQMWYAYVGRDPLTAKRIEITRSNKKELLDALDEYYAAMRKGIAASDVPDALSASNVAEFNAAREALGGGSVLEAAQIVSEARRKLRDAGMGETSILDAVRAFCDGKAGLAEISLQDALDGFLATLNPAQTEYRDTFRSRVGRMVLALGGDTLVSDVTPQMALGYVEKNFAGLSEKTYNGNLGDLKRFFNWCAAPVRAYCKGNPLETAEKRREASKRPEFMQPEEVQAWMDLLLANAYDEKGKKFLWWNALGFFTGARTVDIMRLAWKDVDLEARTILYAEPKGFSHGVPPRFVKLSDAAMAWLTAAPPTRGEPDEKVFPGVDKTRSVSNALARLAQKHGLKKPANAARHTFVTMHVAAYHDAALTESIVGTSSTMRKRHYQNLVREDVAKRYFEEVRPRRSPTV